MYILGLVVGAESIKAVVYTEEYKQVTLKESALGADVISSAEELLRALIESEGIAPCDVKYIGVAVDSSFDISDVKSKLEEAIGINTRVADIISARALGEAYLSRDKKSLVMIKIDDAVDSAIVIDKKIYAGSFGNGGKLGHMVIDAHGYDCECGLKGCFEAYVSRSGIARLLADAGVECAEKVSATELFSLTSADAEKAKKAYIYYLSCALVNIINLFQPQELVLDGDFISVGYTLLKPVMEVVLDEQYTSRSERKCNVRFPRTKEETAALGAALLGR